MIQCEQPPTHADLLRIAGRLRASVVADDDDRLHSELCDLRNALMDHLQSERGHSILGSAVVAHLVADGQRRLLALVNDLLFGARNMAEECNCVLRAAEVDIALRRQAQLEAVVQGRALALVLSNTPSPRPTQGATDDRATG